MGPGGSGGIREALTIFSLSLVAIIASKLGESTPLTSGIAILAPEWCGCGLSWATAERPVLYEPGDRGFSTHP